MGQYFLAVNDTKREYVCPWCIGGGAKLWEWAANPQGAIFTLLLRKSTTSGGDYWGYRTESVRVVDTDSPEEARRSLIEAIQDAAAIEGKPLDEPEDSIVGRWAGDRVYLVGDYDESGLFDRAYKVYRNVSGELVAAWNGFIELEEHQLRYEPCPACSDEGM